MTSPHVDKPKNRYLDAPRRTDFTIDQDWKSYTREEHERWDRLFQRQAALLPGRACDEFLAAMETLKLSDDGIPDFAELSERLMKLTGWQVVPVVELVPDDIFFDHLANKRFPAGAFIRSEAEFDYIEEPDVFHDVFGHVPLLANPVYSDFIQAYGKGGQRALKRGQLKNLARLYWYTVEFGLIDSPQGLRIFGAGIMSSPAETKFSLESTSPNRIRFDLERIMRTDYIIDDFQEVYFVIDSFEKLLEACEQDFGPLYDRVKDAPDLAPHEVTKKDRIVQRGDFRYFVEKGKLPAMAS